MLLSSRVLPIALLSALLLNACVAPPPGKDQPVKPVAAEDTVKTLATIKERKPSPLTNDERKMAEVAWKYFENNYKDTGLVNAVEGYPSTTLWDTASYMGGLMAAYELNIIDKPTFHQRTSKLLGALNRLELFQGELPNKGYHTETLQKVNYANQPAEIGYSAVDLGRMLIWLKIYKERYPQYAGSIDQYVLRWNFNDILDKWGTMYGKIPDPQGSGGFVKVQEGRLGYEEYAAKGFRLWGFNTERASKIEPYHVIPLYGIEIPHDARDPRKYVSHSYVVTENYTVDMIELGWDQPEDRTSPDDVYTDTTMMDFARRIFAVQEARYRDTGILTARTEHQLDQDPYFVYDTIYTDGYPWNTIVDGGSHRPEFAAVALKGAISLWAVWDMPYSDTLMEAVGTMYDPKKGFYEGVYENGKGPINIYTANNNGIILESLLYKSEGKLLRFNPKPVPSLWDKTLKECPLEAQNRGQCMRK